MTLKTHKGSWRLKKEKYRKKFKQSLIYTTIKKKKLEKYWNIHRKYFKRFAKSNEKD